MKARHPMQPIVRDRGKVLRFKKNAIVRFLLDSGPHDLNSLAKLPFTSEDREQFAQLLGYSVSGFGDLEYASRKTIEAADAAADQIMRKVTK